MIHLSVDVHRARHVPHARDIVFERIGHVPALVELLPAVKACESTGPARWRWTFGSYGAFGFEVTPTFEVLATVDDGTCVDLRTVGEVTEGASGRGRIALVDALGGTDVRAAVAIEVDLTVPRVLARPLRGVLVHEVRVVLDGMLDRLAHPAR